MVTNKIKINDNSISQFRISSTLVILSTILLFTTVTINHTNGYTSDGYAIAQSDGPNATNNSIRSQNLDIFHAKGTINGLTSDVLTGSKPSSSAATATANKTKTYVLGGEWSFDVINGKLQDFNVNIVMAPIDGSRVHFLQFQS